MIPFGGNYSDRLEPQTGSGLQKVEAAGIEPANRPDRLLFRIAKTALGVALAYVALELAIGALFLAAWSLL